MFYFLIMVWIVTDNIVLLRMCRNQNTHIRFMSEESDLSDFSDYVEDVEGNEYHILKVIKRLRKKKKKVAEAKYQLIFVVGEGREGSPRKGKGEKKRYQGCSTHRRTFSQLETGDDDWSWNECSIRRGCEVGGKALSADVIPYNSSGIGLLMGNQLEMVPEIQRHNQRGRGSHVMVLAAKRVLELQKDVEVTFKEDDDLCS